MESTIAPIRQVPELSLKKYLTGNESDKKEFIDSLFEGLKDYGFIILKDHSINHQLCQKAYELAKNYFALPESTKTKYISPSGGGQRGHTPFGKEHAKDSSFFDLKEFFHVGRDIAAAHELKSIYPDNIWPNEIIEFQNVFTELYQSFDFCSNVILEALGEALKVPENYFTILLKMETQS